MDDRVVAFETGGIERPVLRTPEDLPPSGRRPRADEADHPVPAGRQMRYERPADQSAGAADHDLHRCAGAKSAIASARSRLNSSGFSSIGKWPVPGMTTASNWGAYRRLISS